MPCCRQRATPKTSVLGNHFFAHVRRGDCGAPSESPEQLEIKSAIAISADAVEQFHTKAEWEIIEGDKEMDADVVCDPIPVDLFDTDAKTGYVFKLLRETPIIAVLEEQGRRYLEAGYRCIWLTQDFDAYRAITPRESAPLFLLRQGHGSEKQWYVSQLNVPIPTFVEAVLDDRLYLADATLSEPMYATRTHTKQLKNVDMAVFVKSRCSRCNRSQYSFAGGGTVSEGHFKDYAPLRHKSEQALLFYDQAKEAQLLPDPAAVPSQMTSTISGSIYWANACYSCGFPIGYAGMPNTGSQIPKTAELVEIPGSETKTDVVSHETVRSGSGVTVVKRWAIRPV